MAQLEASEHAFHIEFEEDDRRLIMQDRFDRVVEEMLRRRWVPDRMSKLLEIKNGMCAISLTKIRGAEFGAFLRKTKKSAPKLGLDVKYCSAEHVFRASVALWPLVNEALCLLWPDVTVEVFVRDQKARKRTASKTTQTELDECDEEKKPRRRWLRQK